MSLLWSDSCQCRLTWFHDTMEFCAALPEVRPEVVAVTVEDFVHDAVCQGHGCYITMVQGDFTAGQKVLQQITRHLDIEEEECDDVGVTFNMCLHSTLKIGFTL